APIKIQPLPKSTSGSIIPSLTDLTSGINLDGEDKGPQYIRGNDKQPFTKEQFLSCWQQYTQKAKDEDKIQLYTLLSSNEPLLDGTHITVLVENAPLESTLQTEKIELLNFL